jgi:hypothetical protein
MTEYLEDKPRKVLVGDLRDFILADNSVTTEKILKEAVTTERIKDDAVTTAKIAEGAVTEKNIPHELRIVNYNLSLVFIDSYTIPGIYRFNNSDDGAWYLIVSSSSHFPSVDRVFQIRITNDKIEKRGAVMGSSSGGSNTLRWGEWTDLSELRDGAVTTEKIKDDAVTKDKIANGAVTADKIPNELRINIVDESSGIIKSEDDFVNYGIYSKASDSYVSYLIVSSNISESWVKQITQMRIANGKIECRVGTQDVSLPFSVAPEWGEWQDLLAFSGEIVNLKKRTDTLETSITGLQKQLDW